MRGFLRSQTPHHSCAVVAAAAEVAGEAEGGASLLDAVAVLGPKVAREAEGAASILDAFVVLGLIVALAA